MITIPKKINVTIIDAKLRPYMFVKAAKDAALGIDHPIQRSEKDDVEMIMTSKSSFDQKIAALNAAKSLPVLFKSRMFDLNSAAIRMDEIYHLVLAKSTFSGNDEPWDLENSGLERKIVVEGTTLDNRVENVVSVGGNVQSLYPIASAASLSAHKAGADLTVNTITPQNLQLGVVSLNDGSASVADGVAIELRYQAKNNLVIFLKDGKENVISVIMSKELSDYLAANV